jgi:hypothetical protein
VAPENVLLGHVVHALAAVTFEYAPAEQFVQALAPNVPNFPFSHATHAPFTVRYPATHGHLYVSK